MIRRLAPDEAEVLREIRLAALLESPTAFATRYEDAARRTLDEWRDLLRRDGNPTFVWDDGHGVQGMVVGMPDLAGSEAIHLVALWVRPGARRRGVARHLVEGVLEWARRQSAPCVRLHVTESNERAERLYARLGFVRTGRASPVGPDGPLEIEMELSLSPGG